MRKLIAAVVLVSACNQQSPDIERANREHEQAVQQREAFEQAFRKAAAATQQQQARAQAAPAEPDRIDLVTANELAAAYKDNELAADQKYKGKAVQLQGRVHKVERFAGDIIVQFQAARFDRVRAYLRPSEEGEAGQLHTGQMAAVQCLVKGAAALGTATLKDCVIVPVAK